MLGKRSTSFVRHIKSAAAHAYAYHSYFAVGNMKVVIFFSLLYLLLPFPPFHLLFSAPHVFYKM